MFFAIQDTSAVEDAAPEGSAEETAAEAPARTPEAKTFTSTQEFNKNRRFVEAVEAVYASFVTRDVVPLSKKNPSWAELQKRGGKDVYDGKLWVPTFLKDAGFEKQLFEAIEHRRPASAKPTLKAERYYALDDKAKEVIKQWVMENYAKKSADYPLSGHVHAVVQRIANDIVPNVRVLAGLAAARAGDRPYSNIFTSATTAMNFLAQGQADNEFHELYHEDAKANGISHIIEDWTVSSIPVAQVPAAKAAPAAAAKPAPAAAAKRAPEPAPAPAAPTPPVPHEAPVAKAQGVADLTHAIGILTGAFALLSSLPIPFPSKTSTTATRTRLFVLTALVAFNPSRKAPWAKSLKAAPKKGPDDVLVEAIVKHLGEPGGAPVATFAKYLSNRTDKAAESLFAFVNAVVDAEVATMAKGKANSATAADGKRRLVELTKLLKSGYAALGAGAEDFMPIGLIETIAQPAEAEPTVAPARKKAAKKKAASKKGGKKAAAKKSGGKKASAKPAEDAKKATAKKPASKKPAAKKADAKKAAAKKPSAKKTSGGKKAEKKAAAKKPRKR